MSERLTGCQVGTSSTDDPEVTMIHLITTRGSSECGADGPTDTDILSVTCADCLRRHDTHTTHHATQLDYADAYALWTYNLGAKVEKFTTDDGRQAFRVPTADGTIVHVAPLPVDTDPDPLHGRLPGDILVRLADDSEWRVLRVVTVTSGSTAIVTYLVQSYSRPQDVRELSSQEFHKP